MWTSEAIVSIPQHLLAAMGNDAWQAVFGGPSILRWGASGAYFVAAVLCAMAAQRARRQRDPDEARSTWFWGGLAVLFVLLGLNKLFNVQAWLWLTGRGMARQEGWYGMRKWIQAIFTSTIALGGLTIIALFFWLTRKTLKHHLLALIGAVCVTCFVILRAASFHHVDELLGMRFDTANMNVLLELPGILCVIGAAVRALTRKKTAFEITTGLTEKELESWRKRKRPPR